MEPDDAADLIVDLDQERRLPILEAVPEPKQAKIRALLSYNPETAGGLMSPNFLALSRDTTVASALDEVRQSQVPSEALSVLYIFGDDGKLCGSVSVVGLLKSSPTARLRDVAEPDPITLRPDADLHEIGRKMSDYDLAATPVVDADGRMIGVVTVDDVLELLLPAGWRRRVRAVGGRLAALLGRLTTREEGPCRDQRTPGPAPVASRVASPRKRAAPSFSDGLLAGRRPRDHDPARDTSGAPRDRAIPGQIGLVPSVAGCSCLRRRALPSLDERGAPHTAVWRSCPAPTGALLSSGTRWKSGEESRHALNPRRWLPNYPEGATQVRIV